MTEAQFGVAKILRPYLGFASVYQGQSAALPIMFTEGGSPLDPMAGLPGYSPTLLRGLKVPYGARCSIWLPAISSISAGFVHTPYDWQLTWRMRNVHDYRVQRIPYHYPKQAEGVPDTSVVTDQTRVVLPAGHQIRGVSLPADPATPSLQVAVQLRSENAETDTVALFAAPLLSAGVSGQYQQGLLDPAATAGATLPLYMLHEVACQGDELLIGVSRSTTVTANWSLAPGEPDVTFNRLFGSLVGTFPDVGIYVLVGAAS